MRASDQTLLYYLTHIFLFCHWYFVFCPTLSQVLLHWMIMLKPCIQSAHRTWRIRTFIIRLLISSSLTKRTHLWHLLLCIHPQMILCLCEVQLTLSLDIKKLLTNSTAVVCCHIVTSFCSCQMSIDVICIVWNIILLKLNKNMEHFVKCLNRCRCVSPEFLNLLIVYI